MILITVGIGMKGDCVEPMKNGKKVAIVIVVNRKKYVSVVISGHHIVVVLVNVVQYAMNIYRARENCVGWIILNLRANFVNYQCTILRIFA